MSYSTAAVPQQQKHTKVSQARPKPVQNQNNNQMPCEQFATMCTIVSSLCKQMCEAIKHQQPIHAAILTQLDDQCQQTKLLRQQNQSLQQQVQKLTRSFEDSFPDEHDDDIVSKDDSHENSNQWLVSNVHTRAVEESKEVDDQEDQSNSVSSYLSGNIIFAPPHLHPTHQRRSIQRPRIIRTNPSSCSSQSR